MHKTYYKKELLVQILQTESLLLNYIVFFIILKISSTKAHVLPWINGI